MSAALQLLSLSSLLVVAIIADVDAPRALLT
jgi:hypothetical protein